MGNAKKVYDFSLSKTRERLVRVLKSRKESTVADLVAATGLPTFQVQETIKVVLDEYQGQLKATESGELLYTFPKGMKSRKRGLGPKLRAAAAAGLRFLGRASAFLFKVWIMVMLVGYFILFLALLLLALFASVAVSVASRDDGRQRSSSRGMGFGGFYLMTRLFELFIQIWFFAGARRSAGEKGRPLYKSVFAYVFGEGSPFSLRQERSEGEKLRVISFLRGRKGVISLEELAALTGKSLERANRLINAYLLEFEGEPAVTPEGTVVFLFPDLLRTKTGSLRQDHSSPASGFEELVPYNANKPSTNRWITFFNGFNLAFAGYFLYFSLLPPTLQDPLAFLYLTIGRLIAGLGAEPLPLMLAVLGAVPLAFSLLFYAITLLRRSWVRGLNEEIKEENLRRSLYREILAHPEGIDPQSVRSTGSLDAPRDREPLIKRSMAELAAEVQAEVDQIGEGRFVYRFKELERRMKDLEAYREGIDLARFDVGKTVFDSGQ